MNQPIPWLASTKPACEAAAKSNKPVLFFYAAKWDILSMEWESQAFLDGHVRSLVNTRFVPLRIDRSDTYMASTATREQQAIVDEAEQRFKPVGSSQYGSLFIVAPDCKTRLDDLAGVFKPEDMAARLEAATKR